VRSVVSFELVRVTCRPN